MLFADAAVSGVTGILMLVGAGALDPVLGIPAALMRGVGMALLPFAAGVLLLARQDPPPRSSVLAVVALNGGWVAASLLLLASGWIAPTGLGIAFVIVQAVAVAGFAELQYFAIRRVPAAVGSRA